MIEARRVQLSFGDGLIDEEVGDLWEDWMRPADHVLDDDRLLSTVFEALTKRRPKSRTRGRLGTPAEVVLRLLLLKHVRNWSYEVLEREVRANLVYRSFTRVGGGKVPDDTVMNKWALALGPEVIEKIHKRVVAIAQEKKVVEGRKMRIDTTVVETNIHYPTDSSLLGDGVRVLTRAMKRIAAIVGDAGAKLRDRSRSVKYRILEIGRSARSKGGAGKERLQQGYEKFKARLDTLVATKTPKLVKIEYQVTEADQLLTTNLYPRVREGIREGLYFPNRNSNLCSRKSCNFADACCKEFGGGVD